MALGIVTHPHSFDEGIIRKDLASFLRSAEFPVYFIRDGNKEAYSEKLFTGEFKPSNKLGKYGRASLKDSTADKIVKNHRKVLLGGGYLSNCVASTYNSLTRAVERNGSKLEIFFLKEITYLRSQQMNPVKLTELLRRGTNEDMKSYFESFRESELVSHQFVSVQDI